MKLSKQIAGQLFLYGRRLLFYKLMLGQHLKIHHYIHSIQILYFYVLLFCSKSVLILFTPNFLTVLQIYYLDEHDVTGYRVFKNNQMILQCTITQHSTTRMMKGNTCYTAGVEFLASGDIISLGDVTAGKYSLFEPGKSFFGLVKLGDFRKLN